jgi:electron transport complex protein RnfB
MLIMAGIALAIGAGLAVTGRRLRQRPETPLEKLNALLPQTQCAQCGYPGCRPYAEAILSGEADINQCAPGGAATVTAIARLLGKSSAPLDPAYGTHQPGRIAVIDEAACIGCALCLDACPVDAILGAHRYTHTVIRSECTGCELCIAPCPVDCIAMVPLSKTAARAA